MTAVWPVMTLDDIEHMPLRPFNPDEFPTRRDPALDAEKTVDELLAECRQIRADLSAAVNRSRRARGANTGRAAA